MTRHTTLALKLTRTRRVSHVDDLLIHPAAALFAGLAVAAEAIRAHRRRPYRLSHDHQQQLPGRPGQADDPAAAPAACERR